MDLALNDLVNEWSKESGKSVEAAILDVARTYRFPIDYVEHNVRNAPFDSAFTQSEIERDLGVTRQNVSQILKRGLRKIFKEIKKAEPEMNDFEAACHISQMMSVDKSQLAMIKFFKLFPKDIKDLIKDAGVDQCTKRVQELLEDETL